MTTPSSNEKSSASESRPADTGDLLALPFPHKLWLLVNDPDIIVCTWSRNGTAIRIRIDLLDGYLANYGDKSSIFRTQIPCLWLRQLRDYGFQQIGEPGSASPAVLSRADLLLILNAVNSGEEMDGVLEVDVQEYRHESFRRDRPQLLDTIRRLEPCVRHSIPVEVWEKINQHRGAKRPPMSLANARLWLTTLLKELALRTMLASQLERCARTSDSTIQLDADVFENACGSLSGFEQRDVAGYYGDDVDMDTVKRYFGPFVPTYATEDGVSSVPSVVSAPKPVVAVPTAPTKAPACDEDSAAASDSTPTIAIPQFQIVHNASATDASQAYSLQISEPMVYVPEVTSTPLVVCSDYGAQALANINRFTEINYDTSFLTDAAPEQIDLDDLKSESVSDTVAEEVDQPIQIVADGEETVKDEYILITLNPEMDKHHQENTGNDGASAISADYDDDDNFDIDQLLRLKPPVPIVDVAASELSEQSIAADTDSKDPIYAELQAMQCGDSAKEEKAADMQETPPTVSNAVSAAESSVNDIIQQAGFIDEDFMSKYNDSMNELYDKMLG